jgi:hypothetical protein
MLHAQTVDKNAGENSAERRRHSRQQTRENAELFLGAAQPNHICMVLDRSSSGVQIDLGETIDLPETMIIQFSSEASQLVRRCWAAGTRAGMEFIGPVNNQQAPKNAAPPPRSLPEIAAQIAASLQQIEFLIRDYLNVGQEEPAVFFSEIGSRPGAQHRHRVTIIAPQAEAATRRMEAAINQMTLQAT